MLVWWKLFFLCSLIVFNSCLKFNVRTPWSVLFHITHCRWCLFPANVSYWIIDLSRWLYFSLHCAHPVCLCSFTWKHLLSCPITYLAFWFSCFDPEIFIMSFYIEFFRFRFSILRIGVIRWFQIHLLHYEGNILYRIIWRILLAILIRGFLFLFVRLFARGSFISFPLSLRFDNGWWSLISVTSVSNFWVDGASVWSSVSISY